MWTLLLRCLHVVGKHFKIQPPFWGRKVMLVKCTLLQALRLCIRRMAHKVSRGIDQLFLDHGSRRGWGASVTPRPLFNPRKDPVPIIQEAGWAPEPVWTGAENLAPIGIRFRTVQPVASRYTDYATPPTSGGVDNSKFREYSKIVRIAVAQWLRRCATNRKVAGSIQTGFTGIFHWHKILPIALWPWGRISL